jgi:hypothetical protein
MARLHGPRWRQQAGASSGRFLAHGASTASLLLAALGHRWVGPRRAALVAAPGLVLTADFARRRIAAGPRSLRHVAAMAATSLVVPPVAVAQRLRGELRARALVVEPIWRS